MNIISSTWKYKCPRCRVGDQFVKPLQLTDPLNMNDQCDSCGLRFTPEPGYYYGAMFVSYIWTAFSGLAIVGFAMLILDWSINSSFALLIFLGAISFILVLRLSRSMYLHLDVRYDPSEIETFESKSNYQ